MEQWGGPLEDLVATDKFLFPVTVKISVRREKCAF